MGFKLPQFSLLTFMFGCLALALGIGLVLISKRVSELESKNAVLQEQLGHFEVTDENKIYIRYARPLRHDCPSWHIYIPRNREYRVHLELLKVPKSGFPDDTAFKPYNLGKNDHWLEFNYTPINRNTYQLKLMDYQVESGGTFLFGPISNWIPSSGKTHILGRDRVEVLTPSDEKIELMRYRFFPPTEGIQSYPYPREEAPEEPCPGILIWLEPVKQN